MGLLIKNFANDSGITAVLELPNSILIYGQEHTKATLSPRFGRWAGLSTSFAGNIWTKFSTTLSHSTSQNRAMGINDYLRGLSTGMGYRTINDIDNYVWFSQHNSGEVLNKIDQNDVRNWFYFSPGSLDSTWDQWWQWIVDDTATHIYVQYPAESSGFFRYWEWKKINKATLAQDASYNKVDNNNTTNQIQFFSLGADANYFWWAGWYTGNRMWIKRCQKSNDSNTTCSDLSGDAGAYMLGIPSEAFYNDGSSAVWNFYQPNISGGAYAIVWYQFDRNQNAGGGLVSGPTYCALSFPGSSQANEWPIISNYTTQASRDYGQHRVKLFLCEKGTSGVATPSGNIAPNQEYKVTSTDTVTYNGTTYSQNQAFRGVAGVTTYTGSGSIQTIKSRYLFVCNCERNNINAETTWHRMLVFKINQSSPYTILTWKGTVRVSDELGNRPISYCAFDSNVDKILVQTYGNLALYSFDWTNEKLVLSQTLMSSGTAAIRSFGVDSAGRIWVYENAAGSLWLFTQDNPVSIMLTTPQSRYDYSGTNINTSVAVSAVNYLGNPIAVSLVLTLEGGNAVWTDNNASSITVVTSASGPVNVNLTITGSGFIRIAASSLI